MARASADYTWNFAQWTIGLTGLITDKLGMAPHKDTFYTVRRMPDNNNVVPENYPDLHRYFLYPAKVTVIHKNCGLIKNL